MGPNTTMNSNSDSTTLAVPKFHDNRSNWADYQPRIQYAMGAKGLWRHVEGSATMLVPLVMSNGVPMLADGKTVAMEDQIEMKESKIIEFEKREYLACYILMSTTSTCLATEIKGLLTAKDMWKVIKDDATSKSMLYILDTEDQLSSIKLADNDDLKTYLAKLKTHFQLMLQHHDNLMKIGLTMSDTRFNIIIMSSLPEFYWPTLQTIIAAERANKLSGLQANTMKADDLIAFIIEEAQHQVINNDQTKTAESALMAHMKKTGKLKGKRKDKPKTDVTCENCERPGHSKDDCWSKGSGKEGQGPRQQKKGKKSETIVAVTDDNDKDKFFTFTCTSDYVAIANTLDVPKSRLGTCIDSGASRHYCPN